MATNWNIGDRISDRYLIEAIHQGGLGTVYVAYDNRDCERFAIKSPRDERIASAGTLERFIKEANLWVSLGIHPNIVQARFLDSSNSGRPLLFLEFIEGANLRVRMRESRLSLPLVIDFAIQFCQGMHYAFQRLHILHRDIKPENVLITPEGLLKVTDFGLATALSSVKTEHDDADSRMFADRRLTRAGAVCGTLPYMSFEQLEGKSPLGIESDVYAFGVLLYELITQRLPFQTSSNEPKAWLMALKRKRPESPSSVLPSMGLPRELDALVMSALTSARNSDFRISARFATSY